MPDDHTKAPRHVSVQAHLNEVRRRGLRPEAFVIEDAYEDLGSLVSAAQRDHPHTDAVLADASQESARMPPHPKHVWLLVSALIIFGVVLSWWAVGLD